MFLDWLKEAKHVVVFTGAGMSTESGLPDFRSSLTGLWTQKDPRHYASTEAMRYHRDEFIAFYRMRIETLLKHKPHKGHEILARWEKEGLIQSVITQNVDGFHQKAGSQKVIELHGTLHHCHCNICGRTYENNRFLTSEGIVCEECKGFVRPSVVLFGESLPMDAIREAEKEAARADLFIVLGSSLQVYPANQYPILAKEKGARLVIVNMEETVMDDYADLVIHGEKIGDWLSAMDRQLKE
jgi:NAD-dependent deacetylase